MKRGDSADLCPGQKYITPQSTAQIYLHILSEFLADTKKSTHTFRSTDYVETKHLRVASSSVSYANTKRKCAAESAIQYTSFTEKITEYRSSIILKSYEIFALLLSLNFKFLTIKKKKRCEYFQLLPMVHTTQGITNNIHFLFLQAQLCPLLVMSWCNYMYIRGQM